ncbi:MAG: 2-amino-4-hydroxy-6-hydroxymethyldihydropteridine diphosphokinase [Burkholderiales bacterium]|nr:2-amino-4-hydroxy-6-hydroxymethyldihydropteridine diphosphokinase [Burkholderiales bacterium]
MVTPSQGVPVTAYIGLGANLGEARSAVLGAMSAIADLPGVKEIARSSLYGSAPVDADGSDYVNAVMRLQTTLPAHQLLAVLQRLEHGAGRTRSYRNAPRTLDLDVLLYGNETMATPNLIVPHPRMWERAFVLQPLAELDPQLVSYRRLEKVANQRIWRLI